MRNLSILMLVFSIMSISISAQNTNSSTVAKTASISNSNSSANSDKPKRAPVFRANKDQITQAQTILKQKGLYSGEANGKLDDTTRDSLKKFQDAEKIRATGTLNRITLEKMGIELTDSQKMIPISESSKTPGSNIDGKTKSAVFRATKVQITQAQKFLKDKNLYTGEQDGKMNDGFRDSLKKYQEMEKIKVTGTLNRETLEKMGIPLTDSQKAMQTGNTSAK